jgi:hypothetical protein
MTDLLDHPIVSERYFFPRPDRSSTPWEVEANGERLACSRLARHGGPALLHFHGNGEVTADWCDSFVGAFDAEGIDVFLGEYRGYGGSTGRPALAAMLDDALAIADATGVDPRRTVVYGRSVGSLYALHVAANRPVAGLVIESGIADVLERLLMRLDPNELGVDDETFFEAVRRRFDHRAKIEATTCPVLVLHAKGDWGVVPKHAETLAAWAGERAELVLFDRGDHNSIHAYNAEEIHARVAALCHRTAGCCD